MAAGDNTLVLIAGGDTGPVKQPVDRLAELVLPTLRQADVRLVQCERTYSARSITRAGVYGQLHPELASLYRTAGIDVVSLASNHAMKGGPEPLLDTVDLFHSMGIQTIGAGINAEEARRPAIVERNGVKVAILGYCSVLRPEEAAGPKTPGVAPVRARTYYEPRDLDPGCPPDIISMPEEQDVAALQEDIRKAKAQADAVVVFIHWGISGVEKTIATYQPPVAHAAIDAGADVLIGHHPHVPMAVEVYKGKVCFYSIGNFMTTGSASVLSGRKSSARWNLVWTDYEPGSLYGHPAYTKQAILSKVTFSKDGVERVAFLLAYINELAQPEVLAAEDPRFNKVMEYMEWVSDQVPHTFRVDGDEVVVVERSMG